MGACEIVDSKIARMFYIGGLSFHFDRHQALQHLNLKIPLPVVVLVVLVTMDCQLHQLIQTRGRELLDKLGRHSIWVHVK